jgi:hypothetical protein
MQLIETVKNYHNELSQTISLSLTLEHNRLLWILFCIKIFSQIKVKTVIIIIIIIIHYKTLVVEHRLNCQEKFVVLLIPGVPSNCHLAENSS